MKQTLYYSNLTQNFAFLTVNKKSITLTGIGGVTRYKMEEHMDLLFVMDIMGLVYIGVV